MKKVKLIPSLIMLVLCIGVLAIGVYALSPISNSIAGTISISAGKASLAITGYVDNTIVYPRTELHGGMDWTIDGSKLNFDASNYFFPEQVPSKEIKLVIENLSNKPYGVFFCDYADVSATSSNIKTSGEVKSGTTTIVNASMDYYKYISVADSSTTLDQVEMTITLSVANISTSAQTGSFKYYLNVEEYDSSLNTAEEFIKVDDSLTAIEASAYADNTSIKNVIIPNTITSIGASAFSGCTGLKDIYIPASVTTIGSVVFDGCSALEKITVEAHSTSGDFGGSANLPTITDKSWYLNGEEQTSLAYSTEKSVYIVGEASKVRTITVTYVPSGAVSIDATVEVSGGGEYEIDDFVTLTLTSTDSSYDLYWVGVFGYDNAISSWVEIEKIVPKGSQTVSYTFQLTATSYTEYRLAGYFEPAIPNIG